MFKGKRRKEEEEMTMATMKRKMRRRRTGREKFPTTLGVDRVLNPQDVHI